VARGAEFFQKRQYAQAEQEYRAAYMLDPMNADYKQNHERMLQQMNQ
jgi:hypothetical protein